MTDKDKKRAFTQTQKNEILARQQFQCARCGKLLNARAIDYHHKKPFSEGGETTVDNGEALCPECHREISHEMRLKEIESGKQPQKHPSRKNKPEELDSRLSEIDKEISELEF